MVLKGFSLKLYSIRTMWALSHFGNATLKIPPYMYLLKYRYDLHTPAERSNLSRIKLVMSSMEEIAQDYHGIASLMQLEI